MAEFSASAPEALNAHLDNNPYLGGDLPSDVDAKVFNQFKNTVPDRIVFPHLWAWYVFLSQYNPSARNAWKATSVKSEKPKKEEKKEKAAKEEEDDEEFDPFAEEEDGEETSKRLKEEKAAEKKKNLPIAKSYVVFEVKPTDSSVDMDALADIILGTIKFEGLLWKTEYKKEPVAYGIFKLLVAATIEDEKVSTDIMIEQIEEIQGLIEPESDEEEEEEEGEGEEAEQVEKPVREKVEGPLVQSVDILTFQKL